MCEKFQGKCSPLRITLRDIFPEILFFLVFLVFFLVFPCFFCFFGDVGRFGRFVFFGISRVLEVWRLLSLDLHKDPLKHKVWHHLLFNLHKAAVAALLLA